MTSLKCWNSGVESNGVTLIKLPKRAYACRAPVSSCPSRARLCLRLRFTGQFIIRQSPTDNLPHDNDESFGVREFAVIVAKRLLISIHLKVNRLHAYIRALQSPLEQAPEVLQSIGVNASLDVGLGMVE